MVTKKEFDEVVFENFGKDNVTCEKYVGIFSSAVTLFLYKMKNAEQLHVATYNPDVKDGYIFDKNRNKITITDDDLHVH